MQDRKPPPNPDAVARPAEEAYSEEEAGRRRDAALKQVLGMPPKPHKPTKAKKSDSGSV